MYQSFGTTPPPFNIPLGSEYLINHLNELGWYGSNGMGLSPLSFTEIKAYIDTTNASISGDEVLLIRKMSQSYIRFVQDKNPDAKSPIA